MLFLQKKWDSKECAQAGKACSLVAGGYHINNWRSSPMARGVNSNSNYGNSQVALPLIPHSAKNDQSGASRRGNK